MELQVASLKTILGDLRSKNDAVDAATTQLCNAHIARDNIVYNNVISLVDKTLNVKAYVKYLFVQHTPNIIKFRV